VRGGSLGWARWRRHDVRWGDCGYGGCEGWQHHPACLGGVGVRSGADRAAELRRASGGESRTKQLLERLRLRNKNGPRRRGQDDRHTRSHGYELGLRIREARDGAAGAVWPRRRIGNGRYSEVQYRKYLLSERYLAKYSLTWLATIHIHITIAPPICQDPSLPHPGPFG